MIKNRENIVVGQRYRHVNFPETTYLGVCLANGNKSLIIIDAPEDLGTEVVCFEPDYVDTGDLKYVEGFYPVNKLGERLECDHVLNPTYTFTHFRGEDIVVKGDCLDCDEEVVITRIPIKDNLLFS